VVVMMLLGLVLGHPAPAHARDRGALLEEARDGRLKTDTRDPLATDRRTVRILVSYSETNYFVVEGRQRGLEYELMEHFRKFLNAGTRDPKRQYNFIYLVRPFDQLLPKLVQGEGDIVAAGLTITPERRRHVAFTRPYLRDVAEIVVQSRRAPPVERIETLAGRRVHVVRGSSYLTHLRVLNARLAQAGLQPVDIVSAPPSLEAEDLLQMVNADIYRYTVVDSHIARLWAEVLEDIRPRPEVAVHQGGELAWAVRPDNRRLLERLNTFVAKNRQGTLLGNILFRRYFQDTRWIKNPFAHNGIDKLVRYRPLFEKYGRKYGFDWSLLAALAFQESGFDAQKRNPSGAVGLMQIKPATAADKNIGIHGIEAPENNVHAAARYLDFLHRRYFSGPEIPAPDQIYFTLAAYNAGPARIQSLRKRAAARGLDLDRWFANVEQLAPWQTVHYVSDVLKYAIAFASADQILNERERVRSDRGQAH